LVFPGVKSVIALLMNYFPPVAIREEDNFIISKYAYGKDDHVVVKERMKLLEQFIAGSFKPSHTRSFYDSVLWLKKAGPGAAE